MAAVGCRPARPRPPLAAILPAPDVLLADITARRRGVTSMRGIAHNSYERAEEDRSRHAVVVAPLARSVGDAVAAQTLAVLTANGRKSSPVWVRRPHHTIAGREAASMGAWVPLGAADVDAALLGLPPGRSAAGGVTSTTAGCPCTSIADGRRILVRRRRRSRRERDDAAGAKQVLRIAFADYRTIGGVALPLDVDMRLEPAGRRVHVRYDLPTIDATIPDSVFTFPVQEKVEELRLDRYPGGPS